MNKFWNRLYKLPRKSKPKRRYASRAECEEHANRNGFIISWDHYGKGKHRVSPDELGEGIAYGTDEVLTRVTNND